MNLYKGKNRLLQKILSTDGLMIGLLLFLCIYYGYQNLILLEPQSLHKWRQSDSASLSWNYFHSTINLFQPEINNRFGSGDGKVASEFPLINYLAGMLSRVLGYGPWIHRSLNIFVVLAGLFALYKGIYLLLRDRFWSVVIPMLVFTSPMLVFFTHGFIPDPPALGLCFIAWYYLIRYQQQIKNQNLWLSGAFFTLAGLIKISFGISIIALLLIWISERMDVFKLNISSDERRIFIRNGFPYPVFFIGILAIWSGWYFYASWYSTGFQNDHFLNIILPIYKLPQEEIAYIWNEIFRENFMFLYHTSVHFLIWGLLIAGIFRSGKPHKTIWSLALLLMLGGIIYLGIFYKLIGGHQYYHLVNLVPATALFIYGAFLAKKYIAKTRHKQLLYAGVIVLLAFNIYHAKLEMQIRYYGRAMHEREKAAFYKKDLTDFLKRVGVSEDELVISMPDDSPNNTLYLLRRKGWSLGREDIPYGTSIEILLKNSSVSYLIISDTSLLYMPDMKPYLTSFQGNFEDLNVYRLGR